MALMGAILNLQQKIAIPISVILYSSSSNQYIKFFINFSGTKIINSVERKRRNVSPSVSSSPARGSADFAGTAKFEYGSGAAADAGEYAAFSVVCGRRFDRVPGCCAPRKN